MAMRYYDEALANKIRKWVRDDSIKITSPDETRRLFEYQADINNDKPIALPLVAIRRRRDVEIKNTNKNTLSFSGKRLKGAHKEDENGLVYCNVSTLNAIPIDLGYQIDIYTRYAEEADEYLRNFTFNLINHPEMEIDIPYNDAHYIHQCTLDMESPITDNSDIPERLVPGQFTRWTISLRVSNAYLFSVPIKKPYHVEGGEVKVEIDKPILITNEEK